MLRTQWTRRLRLAIAALMAVVLLAASMGASIRGAEAQEPPGLARALEAKENNVSALMAHPGVVGVGVGLNAEGEHVVRVLLARDGIAGLPSVVDRVPVETVVSGLIVARCAMTTDDCDPAPLGVSIGHPDVTAGTLGALVTNLTGEVFILSNNHVLANVNNASSGDNILQPGSYDGGTDPADTIATLADFVPLDFGGGVNFVDAAIALTTEDLVSNWAFPSLDGYGTPTTTPDTVILDTAVRKCGRTTGCTSGTVSFMSLTVSVCYQTAGPFRCKKSARFENQIGITDGTFSAGGDSGSLIVDADGDPVGLLFAGSDTMTIANPIEQVLSSFDVTMFAGNVTPDPTATATPVPTPDPTATATPVPTPDPTPTTDSLTLTDFGSVNEGKSWVGWVQIDLGGISSVDWSWSTGGQGTCGSSVGCTVDTGNLRKKIGSATLTITDPDDSTPLAQITVFKP